MKIDKRGTDLVNFDQQFEPVVTKDDPEIRRSLAINKLDSNQYIPTSVYAQALQKERLELSDLIDAVNNGNGIMTRQKGSKYFAPLDKNDPGYYPNSKLAWINVTLKNLLDGQPVSICDVQYANTIWMEPEVKSRLVAALGMNKKENISYNTLPPKGGKPYSCHKQKGSDNYQFGIFARNPGFVASQPSYNKKHNDGGYSSASKLQPNGSDRCSCEPGSKNTPNCDGNCELSGELEDIHDQIKMLKNAQKQTLLNIADIEQEGEYDQDMHFVDHQLVGYLAHLRDELLKDRASTVHVKQLINTISSYYTPMNNRYLESLLQPSKMISARYPTRVPQPSATFSTHSTSTITTNATGNVAWAWTPSFISSIGSGAFGVNNDLTLTGTAANAFFLSQPLPQLTIPSGLYTKHRLISACIKATYVGSQLNSSGYILQSAQTNLNTVLSQLPGAVITQFTRFGDFDSVQNGYYVEEVASKSNATSQINYLPIDSSASDYVNIDINIYDTTGDKFTFTGYCQGAQPTAAVVKLDFYATYECIVAAEARDYMPTDVYRGPLDEMERATNIINNVAYTKKQPTSEVVSVNKAFTNLDQLDTNVAEDIVRGRRDVKMSLPKTPGFKGWLKGIAGNAFAGVKDYMVNKGASKLGSMLLNVIPGGSLLKEIATDVDLIFPQTKGKRI